MPPVASPTAAHAIDLYSQRTLPLQKRLRNPTQKVRCVTRAEVQMRSEMRRARDKGVAEGTPKVKPRFSRAEVAAVVGREGRSGRVQGLSTGVCFSRSNQGADFRLSFGTFPNVTIPTIHKP